MSDTPTTIDRKPMKEVIESERRFVEVSQIYREVVRDSWMDDNQALRYHCVALACGVVEKPIFGGNDESPKVEEAVIRIASAFERWVLNIDDNAPNVQERLFGQGGDA